MSDELKRLQQLKLKHLQDQKDYSKKVLDLNTGSIPDFITSRFFPKKLYEQQSNIYEDAASKSGDKAIKAAKDANIQKLLDGDDSIYDHPGFDKLKQLLKNKGSK